MNILVGPATTAIRRKMNEVVTYLNSYLPSGALSVDTISEKTSGSGVTVDSVLLKDGKVHAADGAYDDPAITFASTSTMGFYKSSAAELGVAVEDQFVARFSVNKGLALNQVTSGRYIKTQAAPVNSNTDPANKATMADSFIAGLLTATPVGAINYTLPTGTQMDTACASRVSADEAFDFNIINIGAGGIITFVAADGFTIVGNAAVAAATSATFRVRKTAANTFVLYRIA
ncbi:MAG: hypothetical protein M0R17_06945 [Candidatus Omnitrophica bacterium]|jgi:hypothetical protein|nr:hypothetical protein [Candidatus Omnitrophota bacterium]